MEQETRDKMILPATILIASIVLGGFYYASQMSKQKSIERQAEMKMEEERRLRDDVAKKEETEKTQAAQLKYAMITAREDCLAEAEDTYWRYMELNGTGKRYDKTGVRASQDDWNVADNRKQKEIETCLKKFPIN